MKSNLDADVQQALNYLKERAEEERKHREWKRAHENKWLKVGTVFVEGGTMIIGECFTDEDIDKAYEELHDNNEPGPWMIQMPAGKGVIFSTGYGDGAYDVMVKIKDGRVKEMKVKFF